MYCVHPSKLSEKSNVWLPKNGTETQHLTSVHSSEIKQEVPLDNMGKLLIVEPQAETNKFVINNYILMEDYSL